MSEQTQQTGFTLIELVMVLVLIGVLSVGGFSLFASNNSYSTFIAKDLLISQARLAQQIALGNPMLVNPASLRVSVSADEWRFSVQKSGVVSPEVASITSSGNTLQVDGTTLAAGNFRTFTWDQAANLSANHEIRLLGDTSFRVCLSSQGFAYESQGACQ